MYILDIEISENREVKLSTSLAGNSLENNVTLLNFEIPKKYSDYYKYLDIVKGDSYKTQTVLSTLDEIKFSYRLPYELTDKLTLTLQLVMKKGESIFKSNVFKVVFNPSLCATQYLESEYMDTITYIMENKADNEAIDKLRASMEAKLDKSSYYDHITLQDAVNNKKVDKEEGKALSSNDFTDTYKNKVDTNEKDITILKNNTIPELQENIQNLSDKDGVFDNRVSNLEQTADDLTQVVFGGGIQESIQNNEDQIGYLKRQVGDLVPDEKGNITEQLTGIQINSDRIDYCEGKISDFDMKIGYVELALDELHNYAQGLIGGGK